MDKEYIKNVVSSLQERNRKTSLEPDYVLLDDIKQYAVNDCTETLRDMCGNGEIEYHRTINSVGFSLKGGKG